MRNLKKRYKIAIIAAAVLSILTWFVDYDPTYSIAVTILSAIIFFFILSAIFMAVVKLFSLKKNRGGNASRQGAAPVNRFPIGSSGQRGSVSSVSFAEARHSHEVSAVERNNHAASQLENTTASVRINEVRSGSRTRSISVSLGDERSSSTVRPIITEEHISEPFVSVPRVIENLCLCYDYSNIKFSPSAQAENAVIQIKEQNDWELELQINDSGEIHIYKFDIDMGIILDRQEMIKDWLKRNDLIRVWLKNYGVGGNMVFLAFYRDEQTRYKNRGCKSEIVKLTQYLSEDIQYTLYELQPGIELEFHEVYDFSTSEDSIWIEDLNRKIGKLPKKQEKKYLEEGASAVFLHNIEYDVEKDKEIPYVIIYW
nr:MAG TPA: hypothetical protein [Caudoviricetes sp.]